MNKHFKPRKIPSGWILKRIDEVAKTGAGGTPLSTIKEYYDGGNIPWINSGEVGQSTIKTTSNYITELGLKNSSAKIFPKGSILIAMYGATAGKVSFLEFEASTNQAICAIMPSKGYEAKFIKYYFDVLYGYLVGVSTGSARDNLNQNGIRDIEIPFPSESTQKSIVKVLSALDAKIELNNKINAELEAMAKTLYDYWFVQFDFPDENSKPYKFSGGEMIWSKQLKRDIPKGWEVKKLKDIFTFEKGIEPGSSEYLDSSINENCIKFFRVGDIEGESSVYVDSSNKKYVIVEERDVIVTFDGSVGKLGFGLKGAFSGGLRKIYDKSKKIDNSLVYFIFKDERIIATIHKYATGSILLHASSAIDHLTIPLKENIYLQFQKIVKPIFTQMVKNKQENQKLAELRDFLLPMLMNGQIVVGE